MRACDSWNATHLGSAAYSRGASGPYPRERQASSDPRSRARIGAHEPARGDKRDQERHEVAIADKILGRARRRTGRSFQERYTAASLHPDLSQRKINALSSGSVGSRTAYRLPAEYETASSRSNLDGRSTVGQSASHLHDRQVEHQEN